ncbi:MAG: PEP-CTERM sorting domain-containing protein, partial [Puniceicoccales bacterium]|nr:PEP-CTERM sorting domain-containing protein [Puniceicoccales bacterium]
KTSLRYRLRGASAVLIAGLFPFSYSLGATPAGLWEFDDALNPFKATVGNDLVVTGTAPTYSTSVTDNSALSLNGVITTVYGTANYLKVTHGMAANGGGSANGVNNYTILLDVLTPSGSDSQYRSVFQTNQSNSNDAEFFFNKSNKVGITAVNYSASAWDTLNWHRMVISVSNGNFFNIYCDGALFHAGKAQNVGGTYEVDPALLFFADNDNENYPLHVATLALYGEALSAAQVAALGAAGSAVIPEPGTYALMLGICLGGLGIIRRRYR